MMGNTSVTILPPVRMHIDFFEEGLANRHVRYATGFMELPEGTYRKEYIWHFIHVDLKTTPNEWMQIESQIATDRKIRNIEISFEPHPLSYQGLAIIDEIELCKRDSKINSDYESFFFPISFYGL